MCKTKEQLAQDKEWKIMFNLLNKDIPDPWHGAKGIEVMITYPNISPEDFNRRMK